MHQASRREYVESLPITENVDPGRLLITLYDGAIRFVVAAQKAISSGKAVERELYLKKAREIIMALSGSLDRKQDPELCNNLDNIL